MTALAELEKFGYLTRSQQINSKGQFSGIEYNIFEEPQQENTITEKQSAEKQNAENANAENRTQLNTNQLRTNNNKSINKSNTNENAISESEMYDILVAFDDIELAELYRAYIEWRATTEAPMTQQGLKMLIKRCERLSGFDTAVQKAMVETALIQGWKNVFAPKAEEQQGVNSVAEEHARILFGE